MKKQYLNSEMNTAIDENIHSDRDRKILKDRFLNNLTFCELSKKYNLCERQIQRIVKKADKILLNY